MNEQQARWGKRTVSELNDLLAVAAQGFSLVAPGSLNSTNGVDQSAVLEKRGSAWAVRRCAGSVPPRTISNRAPSQMKDTVVTRSYSGLLLPDIAKVESGADVWVVGLGEKDKMCGKGKRTRDRYAHVNRPAPDIQRHQGHGADSIFS